MKPVKTIDYIMQVALISVALIGNIVLQPNLLSSDFFAGSYAVVGAWQLLSVIVHFFIPAAFKSKLRKVYLALLAITLLAGLVCWQVNDDALLGFFFVLLIWSPVLAILYLIACIQETKRLTQQAA